MFASNPCPLASVLLIPLLPGMLRLGAWWARRCGVEDPWGWVMAVLVWGWITHAIGSMFGSFAIGLACSSILLGGAGWAMGLRGADRVDEGPWPWPAMIAGAGLITGAVFWWDFFERYHTVESHFAIANQICNGVLPPRDLYFPSGNLRYHYGVDLLVASAMAMCRLRVDVAYDLVTWLLWAGLMLLSWMLCSRSLAMGGRWAWLVLIAGSGCSPLLPGWPAAFESWADGSCGGMAAPDVVCFFFQAPWMAGFPLLLLGIRLAMEPRAGGWIALPWAVCGLYNLTALAAGGAATAAASLWGGRGKIRRAGAIAAGVLIGVATSPMGMRGAGAGGIALAQSGPAGSLAGNLGWVGASFGLSVLGVWFLRRVEPAQARAWGRLLVAGSACGLGFLAYGRSHDIVKLAATLHIGLNLGCVALVSRCRPRWLAAAIGGLLCAGSICWGARHLTPPRSDASQRAIWLRSPGPADPDLMAAVDFVRARIGPGEMVWAPRESNFIAAMGGFPQPGLDAFAWGMGHPLESLEKRAELLSRADVADLWREGVRWIIIDDRRDSEIADRLAPSCCGGLVAGRWRVLGLRPPP